MKKVKAQARSQTTVHGWPAVFFGLPFAGVGTVIILISLDVIHIDDAKFGTWRGIVAMFGGLFFLAGFSLVQHGIRGLLRRSRLKALQIRFPDEPWRIDHEWNQRGEKDQTGARIRRTLVSFAGMSLFLVPFHLFLFDQKEPGWIFPIVILFFDFILFCMLLFVGYLLIRIAKFGRSFLHYGTFPCYLGSTAELTFGSTKRIDGIRSLKATLRCVQEKYETKGDDNRQAVVCYEAFSHEKKFDSLEEGRELPLQFPLPDDPELATELSARPARFWELEIYADTPGVNFKATFLVPVYKSPSIG